MSTPTGFELAYSECLDDTGAITRLEPLYDFAKRKEGESDGLKEQVQRLQAQLEESFKGVLTIRCTKHYAVPQQNRNEHSGGECGGCLAEERDALKAALKTAINTVECASIDPKTGEELPWYKQAQTALREQLVRDIWKDPEVQLALKEGRDANDIAVLACPHCHEYGYYNQGSHFYCRFCDRGFACITEDEERPSDRPSIYCDSMMTLADTVTEVTDGYDNRTLPKT